MVTGDQQDTFTFFDALYGYVPDDKHGLLWTLQDKRSTWLTIGDGPDKAGEAALRLASEGRDVYVAVSVADEVGDHNQRIKSENSVGLMGLWADIDIATPDAHKKYNLPPTEEAAMELLDACGMQPTLVVHSGHGLQAWWLFTEFWDFGTEDDGERLAAAGLAQRWNTTLRVRAAERSWTVDSTFDLARVMRVPGTLNRKGSPVMPVRLLSSDGPRYEPTDFDAFMVDDSLLANLGITSEQTYIPDEVKLSEANEPPFEKFQVILANNEQFEKTWKRKRKDMPDQTASSYDLSIATQLADGGFTDQEIADAIIAWRRQHKEDVQKALRPDYIRRTLARARTASAKARAMDDFDEAVEKLDEARAEGDPETERASMREVLDALGKWLTPDGANGHLMILHWVRFLTDPRGFRLITQAGEVDLGPIEGTTNWFRFYNALLAGIGWSIPQIKGPEWHRFCALLPRVWEDVNVGLESTDAGLMYSWLTQYLGQRPPMASIEEAETTNYPFVHDGETYITLNAFKRWIYLQHQENISQKELGKRLVVYGAQQRVINLVLHGRRTSRYAWRLPELEAPEQKGSAAIPR